MKDQYKVKLTNAKVKNIQLPETGRVTYRDSELPGFQLRVSSSGIKTFCVRKDLGGETLRVTLGRFPSISAENARREAEKSIGAIASNHNPNAEKKANKNREITIRQCFESYVQSRTRLKTTTAEGYKQTLEQYLADWMDKPLININRDKIEHRHKNIGQKSPTRANTVMRILRALFEYAHGKYENENGEPLILHNPVKRLSYAKSWFKESRRDTYIKPTDIKPWFEAVVSATGWMKSPIPETVRDYLLFILFTGLRREEAASLKWKNVDFDQQTLTIIETKNGHTHILPLSDYLFKLLKKRSTLDGIYVFPGYGNSKYINPPKRPLASVRRRSSVYFTLHDLRRTFITTAESLGIRDYTLKRLLNHRSGGDVTDGYIITDVDRLREPMQQITDRLLLLAKQPGKVVPFPKTKTN